MWCIFLFYQLFTRTSANTHFKNGCANCTDSCTLRASTCTQTWTKFTFTLHTIYEVNGTATWILGVVLFNRVSSHLPPFLPKRPHPSLPLFVWGSFKSFSSYFLFVWSIHPSIDWSIHLSIHHSINPSIDRSIHRSINRSIHWSMHWSIDPSIHRTIHPLINWSIHPYINRIIHQSINQLIHRSIDPSVNP